MTHEIGIWIAIWLPVAIGVVTALLLALKPKKPDA